MLLKNIRASFRVIFLGAATLLIYAIWRTGRLITKNQGWWRAAVFSKWAKTAARIACMRIQVRGKPPAPNSFVVINHLSYMDIAAVATTLECFFVAKSEVRNWLVVGRLAAEMGTVFVTRQKRRDIVRATEEIKRKFRNGEGLVLFPEGTSSSGERVLPFKSSFLELAVAENIPVSYASISYRTSDKEVSAGDEICWWGDADFLLHLWRLFQIKNFEAIITFGEEEIIGTDRKELAENLQKKVNELFTPVFNSRLNCSD